MRSTQSCARTQRANVCQDMHVQISLLGQDPDGQPMMLVGPALVDQPVMPGPVHKTRIEHLQILAGLHALVMNGYIVDQELVLGPGADPPDRRLEIDGETYGLELTVLTVLDFRVQLARIRQVARAVNSAILGADSWPHLSGRIVHLTDDPQGFSGSPAALAAEIAEALKEDLGYQGEGLDLSGGLPTMLPSDTPLRGFYGSRGGVTIGVVQGQEGSAPVVVAGAQSSLTLDEVQQHLRNRIIAKDVPGNDIVIVTTGLVDGKGSICPLDQSLFAMLVDHGFGATLDVEHLRAVVLHHYGTNDLRVIHNDKYPTFLLDPTGTA